MYKYFPCLIVYVHNIICCRVYVRDKSKLVLYVHGTYDDGSSKGVGPVPIQTHSLKCVKRGEVKQVWLAYRETNIHRFELRFGWDWMNLFKAPCKDLTNLNLFP